MSTRMTLASVHKGPRQKPFTVLVYGPEGVGKSSFAADAPDPIFLAAEDGIAHLDVASFPPPRTFEANGITTSAWTESIAAIETLAREQHNFKTLVIDTLDWLEPLCWQHVCQQGGQRSIEAFGYGKGYTAAFEAWRVLYARLEAIKAKGMNIVLLAHSVVKPYQNPEGDNYDRFELKLHRSAAGLAKEWVDAVLFARHEVLTTKVEGKVRAVSTGARVVHTERRAAFDAKNRYGLPEVLPLSWEAFVHAATSGHEDPSKLTNEIKAIMVGLPPKVREECAGSLSRVGADPKKLKVLLNWANAHVMAQ